MGGHGDRSASGSISTGRRATVEPRNPETWYELGAYEYELRRYRDAYRDLNQSYTLDRYGPAGVKGGLLDQARCKVDPSTCPK